jgi:hypothetical protein
VPSGERAYAIALWPKTLKLLRAKRGDKLLDVGQDGSLVASEGPMVIAIELDKARLGDVTGEVATSADANGAISATMKYKGWCRNAAQKTSYIRVA